MLPIHSLEPAVTPQPQSLASMGFEMLATVAAFALLALAITRWLARRKLLPTVPRRTIEVVETRSLGPRRSVHLLKVGSRHVLIGASEAGLQALSAFELDDADFAPREARPTAKPALAQSFLSRFLPERSDG